MPNICIGEMLISGRKECVKDLITTLQAQQFSYDTESKLYRHPHFYRIFDVYDDIYDEYGMLETKTIQFECAWSAYACMFEGSFSYYSQCKHENEIGNDKYKEFYGSTIEKECKRLSLFVEMYTEEPGIGFQEHYVITPNGIEVDEEFPLSEVYVGEYETYDELLEDYGKDVCVTKELFDELKQDNQYDYSPNRVDHIYKYTNDLKNIIGTRKPMCKVKDK